MKYRLISMSLITFGTTLLAGCSSFTSGKTYVTDTQKIYQVEKAARESPKFVNVIWVNKPRKRVDDQ